MRSVHRAVPRNRKTVLCTGRDDDDDDGGDGDRGDCKRGDGGGDGGGDQSIGGFEFTRNIAHTNGLAALSGTALTRAPGFRFPMTSG